MQPTSPPIAWFDAAYYGAACPYLLYLLATWLARPSPAPPSAATKEPAPSSEADRGRAVTLARSALWAGLLLHAIGLVLRARAIHFFPLTNKFESFYAFAFAVAVATLLAQRSPSRLHRLLLPLVGAGFYAAAAWFPRGAFFPPPLMNTLFYPLHVPASFLAYALWTSSAAAAVAVLVGSRARAVLQAVDAHAFWGWCLFSVSMIFGGAWGYVAWGAYFLWDPKVLWSVILWLFYSGYVHLRYWPTLHRPRARSLLAIAGFGVMLVAYLGTSFLFQHGSHSFR